MRPTLAPFGIRPVGQELEAILLHIAALGWQPLASGHHATVHRHPAHPHLVLRTGNCVDGLARWLLLARGRLRPFAGGPVPRFHDLALTEDGGMVVLAERLEEIADGDAEAEDARTLLAGRPLPPDRRAALAQTQPGLVALATLLPGILRRPPDLRPGNLLRRGRTLVLADPDGICLLPGEIRLLHAALAAAPGETAPWTASSA